MAGETSVSRAARNNAEWCDVFCRTHGIDGRFSRDAWTSPERTPLLYPDAVSLAPACSVERLLACIDRSAGCSIKDSFGVLDLSAFGFDVMFTAEWLWQAPPGDAIARPGWSVVADPRELARWELAWGGEAGKPAFFRDELLADARVGILARYDGDALVAGAIANLSPGVIGLSNVFDAHGDAEAAWRDAASTARSRFGSMPVVGYDSGESMAGARRAGFAPIGALVVWIGR